MARLGRIARSSEHRLESGAWCLLNVSTNVQIAGLVGVFSNAYAEVED